MSADRRAHGGASSASSPIAVLGNSQTTTVGALCGVAVPRATYLIHLMQDA
jgi:hypothetical protein